MWIFFWKRPENQIPDQGSVWRVRFAAERIYKSGASGGYFRHTAGAWKYSSGDGHGTDRKWICICKFNYGGDSADQYGSDSGCIITGHTLGRGEQERAQEQAWTFLWLGAIVGAAGAGIILLIRSYVIGLYNITPETKQIAWKLMDAIALIVVFQSVNGVMTKGVLRGGGDTRFLIVADVLFLWIVSVPLGALAGLYWHLDVFWIYVFLKLDQVIKAVWCVFRLKSRKWIKMLSTQLI